MENNKIFNSWSLERGYKPEDNFNEYPLRTLGAGNNTGLEIFLNIHNKDIDIICRNSAQGFKMIFHTPGEMPQVSYTYVRIPRNYEIVVTIKPNMMTTSEDLRNYSPQMYLYFCLLFN